jgi:hypothetical protein
MAMGQTFSPPTHAAIILSLEGVFAAVASYFVLGEVLSPRELLGCALMLVSTFIAKIGFGSLEVMVENKVTAICCAKNLPAVNTGASSVVASGNSMSSPHSKDGRPAASTANEVAPV